MPKAILTDATLDLPDGFHLVNATFCAPVISDAAANRSVHRTEAAVESISITRQQIAAGTAVGQYQRATTAALKNMGFAVHEVASSEIQLDAGLGLLTELRMTGPDGKPIRQLQLLLVRGYEAWTVAGSAAETAAWPQIRAHLERAICSVSFG